MKRVWSVLLHLFALLGLCTCMFVGWRSVVYLVKPQAVQISAVKPIKVQRTLNAIRNDPETCALVRVDEIISPGSEMKNTFLYVRFVSPRHHEGVVYLARSKRCPFSHHGDEDETCAEVTAFVDARQDDLLAFQISAAFTQQVRTFDLSDLSQERQQVFLRAFEQTNILALFKERFDEGACILAEYMNTRLLPLSTDGSLPVYSPDVVSPISL